MTGFDNIKKNFGFGCMRLPMNGEKVDYTEFCKMVDMFMAEGFNYFNTARVYICTCRYCSVVVCWVPPGLPE